MILRNLLLMAKKYNVLFIKENKLALCSYTLVSFMNSICPYLLSLCLSAAIEEFRRYFVVFLLILGIYFISSYFHNNLSQILLVKYQGSLLMRLFNKSVDNGNVLLDEQQNDTAFSQKIINETKNVANYYIVSMMDFFKGVLGIGCALLILLYLNVTVTLSLMIVLGLYSCFVLKTNKIIYQNQKEVMRLQADYFACGDELIENIEQVKYYSLYERVLDRYLRKGLDYFKVFLKRMDIQILQNTSLVFLRYLFLVIYVVVLLLQSTIDTSTYSRLLLVMTIIEPFFSQCSTVLNYVQNRQMIKVSWENLNQIVRENKNEKPVDKTVLDKIEKIELINIHGKYQKCSPITYTFEKNNVYCITGKNGVGKSTLFHILLGFDSKYSGKVMINQHLLEHLDLKKMFHHQIFYMDQSSEVLEFIDIPDLKRQPSRGERQQILLNEMDENIKDALILLDEPSASIDEKQKEFLIKKLTNLSQNNIVLVITHDDVLLKCPFIRLELVGNE